MNGEQSARARETACASQQLHTPSKAEMMAVWRSRLAAARSRDDAGPLPSEPNVAAAQHGREVRLLHELRKQGFVCSCARLAALWRDGRAARAFGASVPKVHRTIYPHRLPERIDLGPPAQHTPAHSAHSPRICCVVPSAALVELAATRVVSRLACRVRPGPRQRAPVRAGPQLGPSWALQRASQRMPVCAERSVRQAATVACTGAGCAPLAIAIAARAVWGAKCIHFRDYANPRRGIKARGAATRLATTRRHRASLFCPVAQKRSARLWG